MSKPDSIQQLKIAVQRQFGMPIKTIGDLKIFQEELEYTTREVISFNTLRRFFNFLPSTKPSTKTISTLCKYLGFNNISNFLTKENSDKHWLVWNNTLRIELSEKLDNTDLSWLKENSKQPNFYLHLATIIKSFIYRKKYAVIVSIFEQDFIHFTMEDYSKFASILCRLFISIKEDELQQLINHLVPLKVFRESALHWYIDYTHLNGYYGKFLEAALTNSDKESHEHLFYELILNYRDFLSNKNELQLIPTKRVKKDHFIVLQGRTYAYNLIYFSHYDNETKLEDTWKEILDLLKQEINIFLFTLEIMIILLLLKAFEKISYLIDLYYEELLSPTNWNGYHVHSTVLLAHCVQLLHESNFTQAKKSFQLINTEKLDGSYKEYNMIFYHLIEYQIELTTDANKNSMKNIENNYQRYVKQTGFSFFSLNYLKNYLNN